MTTLLDMGIGEAAVVTGMDGGFRMQIQLKNLGFHKGVTVRLAKRSAVGGPLMVTVNGSNVAVGRGVAARIQVAPVDVPVEDGRGQDSSDGTTQ